MVSRETDKGSESRWYARRRAIVLLTLARFSSHACSAYQAHHGQAHPAHKIILTDPSTQQDAKGASDHYTKRCRSLYGRSYSIIRSKVNS